MKTKLLILIEPAPYVLDFIKVLEGDERTDILIFFVHNKLSQPWINNAFNSRNISFLPINRIHATLILWKIIRQGKIELLHVAGWHGFVVLFSWFMARIKNVPFFVELDTKLSKDQSGLKNKIKNKIYPLLFSLPTCFLPAGKKQSDFLQHYGVEKSRIVMHQMTVDVSRLMKSIDQLRHDVTTKNIDHSCRFLFVGRLVERKGLSVLLKAFDTVIAHNNQCQLIIVGDGELNREVLAATKCTKNIIYYGHLEGADLLKQYASADVFILPAFDEPWGLVINEAMAASLPVIVTEDVGCTDDLVKQGVNGFLIPTGDDICLSDKMLALANNSVLRRNMGKSSRELIMNWTMEEQVRIIEEVWAKYT